MGESPSAVVTAAMTLFLVLAVLSVSYVLALVVPFVRGRPRPPGDASRFDWHILVPCLNEAAVIGETVTRLREAFPLAHLWIVDDASDDDTAAIVTRFQRDDPLLHLVSRRPPHARSGKGDALNAAYRALAARIPESSPVDRVVIGVFDADGVPAPDCLDVVAAPHLLGDPSVDAVQIEVRMRNRDERHPRPDAGPVRNLLARTLVRMQDIEFRAAVPAIQAARTFTGTVSLGGNGQFVTLDALRTLDDDPDRGGPWRNSLLDDYELALHLALAGRRTACTRDTWVEQEALWDAGRLLVQRTRWSQGTMQCGRHLPAAWRSRRLSTPAVAEISYSLLQPWLQLFVSAVCPVLLILAVGQMTERAGSTGQPVQWWVIAGYALLAVVQFGMWGPLYRAKCEPSQGLWRSVGWGFAYTAYVWCYSLATWRALARHLRGRGSWAKTRRNAEAALPSQASAVPLEDAKSG
ncbi:Glycosyltransferase, catalytic subunit of cellulose synthase and poly-beta-1,6-N-acetylglucosamine synthase [Streptomyces sp. Termitarium-T10T-6]|nr:glycosyltransferase [Streptomyces sp. Termitarium-T10T-6]SCE59331.1 Glycosyltransferase, catalytic subunit of cellulose synthase and poly-beta-1,6-N-acetylglucosamine synthase [Streptomyces sp. Termitarium-T10T-6]